MFELFIAGRYLKSKRKINFITIITYLSAAGITLGVAALVVVLSVFNGFGDLVTKILVNFDPHVQISFTSQEALNDTPKIESILSGRDEISGYNKFAEGKVMIFNGAKYEIVTLKGLDVGPDKPWGAENSIISGKFASPDSDIPEIVLGIPIRLRLTGMLGDTLVLSSFSKLEQTLIDYSLPRVNSFRVSGIFRANNRDYDYGYVFTTFKSAEKALGLKTGFSGYEIHLKNIEDSPKLKSYLESSISNAGIKIYTWYDLHKDLYDVMLIERWAAYFILALIIAVSSFNILGSLAMSVIEKRKDIGILRTMGADSSQVRRIFLYQGLLIGVVGTIAGLILGLGICYLQIYYKIYPLDPMKYIIDAIPVSVRLSDIIAIGAMSLLLSSIAAIYPSGKASKSSIVESVKWE